MNPLVTVTIVTYNSRRFIETCLKSLRRQTHQPIEVVIVDNSSTDGTAEWLEKHVSGALLVRNDANVGFAAGQNQAIRAAHGDWILALNPDARLEPEFVERAAAAGSRDSRTGTVCGKLLRAAPDLTIPTARLIDSAGVYFTPNQRHFDRGWNETDTGQYDEPEYVFGATGAAALYRREMIDDVSLDDGFFDPDFFAYREDADVSWRAQLMGWRCLYEPEAVGYHVRRVRPGRRSETPAALRMHSVRNRFLMRVKNTTAGLGLKNLIPMAIRDVVVVGGCLFQERSSLPAFWQLAKLLPRASAKRRQIMSRRSAKDEYLAEWFQDQPASRPIRLRPAWDGREPRRRHEPVAITQTR